MDPRVDRAVRALERIDQQAEANDDPAGRWTGRDRSGSVTVTIAASGRINSLVLDPGWREALRPDELGTAIISARTQAAEQLLEAWSEVMARPIIRPERDGPAGHTRVAPNLADVEHANPDDHGDAELTPKELSELLSGVADEMSQYRQAHRELRAATRSVTGADGCVAVTVSAERVVSIEFYRDWIRFASTTDIEASTMAAIDAAYAECDHIPASLDERFPAIAAYRAYRGRVS